MSYRILDLDNCIADDAWRIPHINWQKTDPLERYHEYHSLSGFDELRNEALLATHEEIIVLTARPVHYSAVTHEWLRRKGVNPKFVLMRNNADKRSSVEVKSTQLDWLMEMYGLVSTAEITSAYDDRPDVIEMYARRGINCAMLKSIHNDCAYTNPIKGAAK